MIFKSPSMTGSKKQNNMQLQLKNIRAYDKECHGCVKNNKDIMISFMYENDPEDIIYDLFLTQEKAERLLWELTDAVYRNKNLTVE